MVMGKMSRSYAGTKQSGRRYKRNTAKVSQKIKTYINKKIDDKKELKEYINSGESNQASVLGLMAWTSDSCLDMAQGVAEGNRIADKIEVSSIYVATQISFPATISVIGTNTIYSEPSVRVIVVQLKRGFTIAELTAELPTDSLTSPLSKFDIQRRCYVLADTLLKYHADASIYPLATLATSSILTQSRTFPLKLNLKPKIKNVTWDSESVDEVPPDINGAVYIMYLYVLNGGNPTLVTPQVQLQPDVRVTYRDA